MMCVSITLPDGRVWVLRPHPKLVAALLLPNSSAMLEATRRLQLSDAVVLELRSRMTALTEAEAVAAIRDRDVPKVVIKQGFTMADVTVQLQPDSNVLAEDGSRRFRASWRRGADGAVIVDMPLARVQRMNEVREMRAPKLLKSDVDLLRAQEAGDLQRQTSLKDYRRKLRDLPATEQPSVEACTTPEALIAWAPSWPVDPSV